MLDLHRNLFKGLEKAVGRFFSLLPFSPNGYTISAIISSLAFFYFLIRQNLIAAIIFFLIAGLLDFIDGALARYKNQATKKGAYLDTISDRYVEAFLLLGIFFLPLPKILLPKGAWIFLILFGSLMTTYAKAAAREKELVFRELRGGVLSRGERIILYLISLILGAFNLSWMTYLLILIALLTNLTALQRINLAIKSSA